VARVFQAQVGYAASGGNKRTARTLRTWFGTKKKKQNGFESMLNYLQITSLFNQTAN
jgi:hypothetical protein